MRYISIIVFFALIGFISCAVLELTPDDFDKVVDGSKPAFVEFYAPWCGHCKNLAPEYELVGDAFSSKDAIIAKVDADQHRSLGERFDVHGFPTLNSFQRVQLLLKHMKEEDLLKILLDTSMIKLVPEEELRKHQAMLLISLQLTLILLHSMQLKTFLLNSLLHGVDTARVSLLNTKSLLIFMPVKLILSLLKLMPTSTKILDLVMMSLDSQL